MTCYNCTPIPRPGYHAIQAIIHKGIPYCTECGKDVTCELDVEKICGGASQQAIEVGRANLCEKCGNPLIMGVCETGCGHIVNQPTA